MGLQLQSGGKWLNGKKKTQNTKKQPTSIFTTKEKQISHSQVLKNTVCLFLIFQHFFQIAFELFLVDPVPMQDQDLALDLTELQKVCASPPPHGACPCPSGWHLFPHPAGVSSSLCENRNLSHVGWDLTCFQMTYVCRFVGPHWWQILQSTDRHRSHQYLGTVAHNRDCFLHSGPLLLFVLIIEESTFFFKIHTSQNCSSCTVLLQSKGKRSVYISLFMQYPHLC